MPMDAATLQETFDRLGADYVKRLNLRIVSVDSNGVTLALPIAPELVHGGGVLCGQAILAAADTAMLLAMIVALGEFRPMTTVQLQTSFVRPVPGTCLEVAVVAEVVRTGKNLSYGEVRFSTPDGKLVAHATTTYALVDRI